MVCSVYLYLVANVQDMVCVFNTVVVESTHVTLVHVSSVGTQNVDASTELEGLASFGDRYWKYVCSERHAYGGTCVEDQKIRLPIQYSLKIWVLSELPKEDVENA